jgi:hypothetical protein
MLATLQRSLQRVIDLVAFGLSSGEHATESDLKIPGAWFQVTTAGNEALAFADAKIEYPRWLLGCGFRDAIEAVNSLLEVSSSPKSFPL